MVDDMKQTVIINKLTDQELEFQIDDDAKTVNRLKRVK